MFPYILDYKSKFKYSHSLFGFRTQHLEITIVSPVSECKTSAHSPPPPPPPPPPLFKEKN